MPADISTERESLLQNLMAIPASEFAFSCWGRTWLHARSGVAQVFAALGGPWGLREWRAAIELGYRWPDSPRILQALPIAGRSHLEHRNIRPDQLDAAMASGATIIGDALDPRLSAFAARLKNELGVAGPVSTYASLSPTGDAALPHYDSSHVFVLQLEGRKQWKLSPRPVVVNPSRGRRISAGGEVDSVGLLEDENIEQVPIYDLETVVLEPGDMLYVPPGTIHATLALEPSLSVMVNFAPPRFDALIELIVRRTLGGDPKWRGLPAAGPGGVNTDYVNEGLELLRGILAGIDAGSLDVQAAWYQMTANMGALQNSYATGGRPEPARVEPDSRLAITDRYPVRYIKSTDPEADVRVTVYLGEQQIVDTGAGAELLQNILDRRQFVAGEARYWSGEAYEWDVVQAYLENLVQQGLLAAKG
jgi:hypothetical protein